MLRHFVKATRNYRVGISLVLSATMISACSFQRNNEAGGISEKAILDAMSSVKCEDSSLLEKGVRQAAFLWRASDGSETDFKDFVKENYASSPASRERLFLKLERSFELLTGAYNQLTIDLQKPTVLAGPEPEAVDYIFSAYSAGAHLSDDMFGNKIAFITVLNFPAFTLAEKDSLGAGWSRLEWAYARMGDMFTTRIPAEISQQSAKQQSDAENYIADYNIMMGHLLTEDGRRLFPEDMVLLSHWNLRDELKSDYADIPDASEKQEMIYKVMERIVCQDIPKDVINNTGYDWAPFSNRTWKDGVEVKLDNEGHRRYQFILDCFHSNRSVDPYCVELPTGIDRNFEGSMEVSPEEIESIFISLISSPEVKGVAELIKNRLRRELRPYDIWYDGFMERSHMSEDKLTEQTRAMYPDPEAFKADMPRMLRNLGFSTGYADSLSSRIEVEGARGSGHAWPSAGKGYSSFLRTRIGAQGMDYKGYNIATHEFGHNVEQTIDLYDIDRYMLSGVPNTAFTEALAFVFQKRDLQLLGLKSNAGKDSNTTLNIFWGMYEIMGVSLVDMYTWRWLYDNPDADAEQLKDNCIRIAREVWNKWYEPVLGTHDSPILAVYSHMVNSPMYLPNYPLGHIIEYQLEEHFSQLPDPECLGPEIRRMFRLGRLTPNFWMRQAVGSKVSTEPVLKAVSKILAETPAE